MLPKSKRRNWKHLLAKEAPLLLPAAHDALTARIIERVGFKAYQVGGFALDGARFGLPDIDLTRFGEKSSAVREIVAASSLPVLVDCDDGYGDVKNTTHTIQIYEGMGVSAVFIEDQEPPKRCGHMSGKKVIPAKQMENKIRAAVAARCDRDGLFLIARSDAIQPEGLDEALRRAELYLNAGADGLYIEGPRNQRELKKIGEEFKGIPKVVTMLEGGGETPWYPPERLRALGFSMILYPTSVLFRITRTIERALGDIKRGRPMAKDDAVDMNTFEQIVGLERWASVEMRFQGGKHQGEQGNGGMISRLLGKAG
jgi:2,3-dimethylmalate lyase